jgi:hypothetical protein
MKQASSKAGMALPRDGHPLVDRTCDGRRSVVRRYVLSTPHAAAVAREIVREALGGRFTQSIVHDAEVIASELMTMLFERGARGLSLSMAHNGYHAYIEVRAERLGRRPTHDGDLARSTDDDIAEKVLRALATEWGFEMDRTGAAAWATIDA